MGYTKAEVAKPGTAGIAIDVVTTGKGGLNEGALIQAVRPLKYYEKRVAAARESQFPDKRLNALWMGRSCKQWTPNLRRLILCALGISLLF